MKKAKRYLQKYRQAINTIKLNKRIIENLRAECIVDPSLFKKAIDYSKDRVQVSPKDTMVEIIIKDIDRQAKEIKELEQKNREIEEFCAKIRQQVLSMDNCVYYVVLWRHYIDGTDFEKISAEIGYSYSRTTHVHGDALESFEKKYLSG